MRVHSEKAAWTEVEWGKGGTGVHIGCGGGENVFTKLTNIMSNRMRGSSCTKFIVQLGVFEE